MTLEKTVSKTWNEFEDFAIGDIVKLKSGGPNMTIDNTAGTRPMCVWFDAAGTWHTQSFDQGALEKVTAEEKPEASSGAAR